MQKRRAKNRNARVRCADCGDFELNLADIQFFDGIFSADNYNLGNFIFECPSCDTVQRRVVGEQTIEELRKLGVTILDAPMVDGIRELGQQDIADTYLDMQQRKYSFSMRAFVRETSGGE